MQPDVLARFEAVALNPKLASTVRADAIGALAMHSHVGALLPLLADPKLRVEVVRALRVDLANPQVSQAIASTRARGKHDAKFREELRFALQSDEVPAEVRPETAAQWQQQVDKGGDINAGRRVFVHPGSACSRCHRVGELGQSIGPPLTFIGNERPARLLESLLDPSVDPVWAAKMVTTKDGAEYLGVVRSRAANGDLTLINPAAQEVTIPAANIASEREAHGSLMPDGLHEGMTVAQFRDLFAFLRAQNQ